MADAGYIEIFPTELYLKYKGGSTSAQFHCTLLYVCSIFVFSSKNGNCSGNVQNRNFLVVVKDCSIALNHSTHTHSRIAITLVLSIGRLGAHRVAHVMSCDELIVSLATCPRLLGRHF